MVAKLHVQGSKNWGQLRTWNMQNQVLSQLKQQAGLVEFLKYFILSFPLLLPLPDPCPNEVSEFG